MPEKCQKNRKKLEPKPIT